MRRLHVIAAGASKELVTSLGARLAAETGIAVEGVYGAVGAMQERVLAGEACDVVVLTEAQIAALERDGGVLPGSSAPLGQVRTGIAVPAGAPVPAIGSPAELAAALLASRGIYVPDTAQSTAGRHFMTVLQRLGIAGTVAPWVKSFANGAVAMRHLAEAAEENAIGCTQVTEINYTPGLRLVGALPEALGLATIYTAAVGAGAAEPEAAQRLVALLTGPEAASLRVQGGFETRQAPRSAESR
jgi:molybdate transport system substrate-binding protein